MVKRMRARTTLSMAKARMKMMVTWQPQTTIMARQTAQVIVVASTSPTWQGCPIQITVKARLTPIKTTIYVHHQAVKSTKAAVFPLVDTLSTRRSASHAVATCSDSTSFAWSLSSFASIIQKRRIWPKTSSMTTLSRVKRQRSSSFLVHRLEAADCEFRIHALGMENALTLRGQVNKMKNDDQC